MSTDYLPPILVQSAKLVSWLIGRKLLRKDYIKALDAITQKIDGCVTPELEREFFESASAPYFACKLVLEHLQHSDTTTDFFGRASQTVRLWKDIIDNYHKNNIYLAEVAETICDISIVRVPKCRTTIADRQRIMMDLRQKIKEHSMNVRRKEEGHAKACKEFNIEGNEKNIRLRLLEEASTLTEFLDDYVKQLKELAPALLLYRAFTEYVITKPPSVHIASQKQTSSACCPTLKLLIDSGHVLVYTWRTGFEPVQVIEDDDNIQALLEAELKPPGFELESEIAWDDVNEQIEIDFGDLNVESTCDSQIELDENGATDNGNGDTEVCATTPIEPETVIISEQVATGTMARKLLDTMEGRKALLNDFAELLAFLNRFYEDLCEIQGGSATPVRKAADSGSATAPSIGSNTASSSGSHTLQHMIIQNAPACIQDATPSLVAELITAVEGFQCRLTSNMMNQLMMVRTRTGYLDRLVARLMDLRGQVERAKSRVVETQKLIDEANSEQVEQAADLIVYRSNCKQLVSFMEEELTRLCNRQIQIVGQVLDM